LECATVIRVHESGLFGWRWVDTVIVIFTSSSAAFHQSGLPPSVKRDPDLLSLSRDYIEFVQYAVFTTLPHQSFKSVRFTFQLYCFINRAGIVIKLQIVVHLHPLRVVIDADLSEAHLELGDWYVDVAVLIVMNIRDLVNDLLVIGLRALRSILAHVAVYSPGIAHAHYLCLVLERYNPRYGVSMAIDHAPWVV